MVEQAHASREDYFGDVHVYEPHKVGLPKLGPYLREMWKRREFVTELARSNLRSQHFSTVFGQLWLLLNPVLLGVVYFLLVSILRRDARGPDFFVHLLAGLFLYTFISSSISQGANSVVGGGRLILNTAFPRAVLPLSSVVVAFMRFVPTVVVLALAHAVVGLPVGWHLLGAIPVLFIVVLFTLGVAMLIATLQVYFRDTKSFLPYALRIWLYVSPVLWLVEEVPARLRTYVSFNPLYSMIGEWSDIIVRGESLNPQMFLAGAAWALAAFVVGALFFVSREREFAVLL